MGDKFKRYWSVTAAISGFIAVACGAFGAHALRASLDDPLMAAWRTAVSYQMYHSLALLACGYASTTRPDNRWYARAAGCMAAGILLFCGSLYLLVLTGIRGLGMVTPLGGAAFLAGWSLLALAAWQRPRD